MITDANQIPAAIAEAFHLASTGRPGPVLVDIPKDIQNSEMEFVWPPELNLPGYKPTTTPHPRQIEEAVRMISEAKQPVFYIGGGVIKADAHKELLEFVEYTGIPVGARFDDRVTGDVDSFAPDAQVIHADIDTAEISKIREAQVPIVGDAREVLAALLDAYKRLDLPRPQITEWTAYTAGLKSNFPRGWDEPSDGKISPQYVINTLSKIAGPDAVYAAGVGQHQMWSAQFVDFENPRTWLNSGGAGTMGYSIPAAMGAKAGCPDKEVWAIDGDGCFQMTNQELTTCAVEGFPIKVALINNGNLGMVRQWQTLFYEGRYSNTKLRPQDEYIPDFVGLSEAMGCVAIRVTKTADVIPAIEKARSINDRPVVIDFIVGEDAQVWPMVAQGKSNSDIEYALGLRPLFDEDSAAEPPAVIDRAVDDNAFDAAKRGGHGFGHRSDPGGAAPGPADSRAAGHHTAAYNAAHAEKGK